MRFNAVARWYCVVSSILFQFFRVSAILFLVSISVSLATGVDKAIIIVFIAFYTVLGGIEAVIWTDVVQAIILLLGGVFAFAVIVNRLPEGFAQIVEMGTTDNKFRQDRIDNRAVAGLAVASKPPYPRFLLAHPFAGQLRR